MNKNILNKLVKIADNQQKALIKLSQLTDDIEYLTKFLRSSIGLFLVNNNIFAKENHTLEQIDPNHYKLTINLMPATKAALSESVDDELRNFLTAKIQSDPNLKSKTIDLDVQTNNPF